MTTIDNVIYIVFWDEDYDSYNLLIGISFDIEIAKNICNKHAGFFLNFEKCENPIYGYEGFIGGKERYQTTNMFPHGGRYHIEECIVEKDN